MTEGCTDTAETSGANRYVPLVVFVLTLLVLLVIPLKIIGYGYLPRDDALADAAKAVSGKPWQEILVLKSDYKIDNHIGWHTFLRQVYLVTKWDDQTLVLFSLIGLFTLMAWSALPWLQRPEAWLITLLLALGVETPLAGRMMLGRPLMISFFMLLTILFLWQKRGASPPGRRDCALMILCMALAILLHGVWYFWVLLVAAFFFARQCRWGLAAAGCWMAGTILAAVLTGHPVIYLTEAWLQAWNVIGRHSAQSTLATELRPGGSNYFPLLLVGGLMILRQLARLPSRPLNAHPAFWLAAMGWVLGHQAERFWDDWGLPALMALMTGDLDLLLSARLPADSLKRLAVAGGLALTAYVVTTTDVDSRWTGALNAQYLTQDDPELAGWLPEAGGIFYKADMEFFFNTFYRNPTAPWRYMVGYEPVLMPPEDFATYQRILWNNGNSESYEPWIRKMRPQDRLVVDASGNPSGYMTSLEWKHAIGTMWIGRKKQTKN
jgi:hypothetical protein